MRKSEKYAWIGTIISTVAVIIIMFYVVLPGLETPEEGGIMVSFGNADDGAGFEQTSGVQEEVKPSNPVIKKEELLTQKDKSVVMPETKKTGTTKTTKPTTQTNTDEQKKKDQLAATQKANDLIGGSFGSSSSSGSGNTNSDASAGNPVGKGNSGGNSWLINGRKLSGSMPAPKYDQNEEGYLEVQIKVDASGNVISATISKGNITNESLRENARNAALKTKFTPGSGFASGTITYNFKLK
jgi:TonB family protein